MKECFLTEIDPLNESMAVAAGKIVVAALCDENEVCIAENDLSECEWAEMVAYLRRRGIRVVFDHDGGLPRAF